MKSKKLGTMFLSMLLVFTLLVAVGCGKDEDDKTVNPPTPQETDKPTDKPNDKGGSGKTDNSSNTNTDLPALNAYIAAVNPAGPAPIIITSFILHLLN